MCSCRSPATFSQLPVGPPLRLRATGLERRQRCFVERLHGSSGAHSQTADGAAVQCKNPINQGSC